MGKSRWSISRAQREALAQLTERMCEKGHRKCSLARRVKTHQKEFAVFIQNPSPRVLLVRPTSDGAVTLQPTECETLYAVEKEVVHAMPKPCPVVWLEQPDPRGPRFVQYIALEDRKRCGLEKGQPRKARRKTPPQGAA